jgi:hypothetical protein
MRSSASSFHARFDIAAPKKWFVHDIFGQGFAQKECASAPAADLKARCGAACEHYKHMKNR